MLSEIYDFNILHEPFNDNRAFSSAVEHWITKKNKSESKKILKDMLSSSPGFKHCVEVQPNEFNEILVETVADLNYKHIFLFRPSAKERLLSLHFAETTNVWFPNKNKSELDGLLSNYTSSPIDTEELINHETKCRDRLRTIYSKFKDDNFKFTTISYNDLFQNDLSKVASILVDKLNELHPTEKKNIESAVLKAFNSGKADTNEYYNDAPNIDKFRESVKEIGLFNLD